MKTYRIRPPPLIDIGRRYRQFKKEEKYAGNVIFNWLSQVQGTYNQT